MLKTISLCALLLALPAAWGSTLTHDYDLTSSLNDQVGSAALVSLGGSISGSGYTFAANQGLNLSSALANIANYSILMDFSFQNLSGYRKILDFKNLASDDGLYNLSTDLNYFNFSSKVEVPFKILVAHEKPVNPATHYTADPNTIVATASTTIKVKQKNLGIIIASESGCRFYFAESDLGGSISARGHAYIEQARKYLLNFYTDSIVLNDVLLAAGAELVDTASEAEIDLSPESIDKTSILELLRDRRDQDTRVETASLP